MEFKIISRIHTRDELNRLLDELTVLKKSLYKTDNGWKETLDNSVRSWVAGIIMEELNAGNMKPENYLRELSGALNNLRTIKVIIGVEPSLKMITAISHWMELNMGTGWIADIDIDKKILGGARVAIDGRFYDVSLASILQKVWNDTNIEAVGKSRLHG